MMCLDLTAMDKIVRKGADIDRVIDIKHSQCLVQLTDGTKCFRQIKLVPECYIRNYALAKRNESL